LDAPPFVFYYGFLEDWEEFSYNEKRIVREFLEFLRDRYADHEAQKEWQRAKDGKYWAAWLPAIQFRVYWMIVSSKRTSIAADVTEEIHVLVVERMPGRR